MKSCLLKCEDNLDTKNKIYNICIDLMLTEDFKNLNIAKLCKACDISVGGFYNYFSSIDDIIIKAFEQSDIELGKIMKNTTLSGNSVDRIRETVKIYMIYINNIGYSLIRQLYITQINKSNEFIFTNHLLLINILDEFIIEGQNNNLIKKNYTHTYIRDKLIIYVRGIVFEWCTKKRNSDLVSTAEKSIDLFLNSFII